MCNAKYQYLIPHFIWIRLPRWRAPVPGRFQGPEMAVLHLVIIADCLSQMAVHCWQLGLPCWRHSHLEQSASKRQVHILYICFPRTTEGFPLQAFLSMTRYLNFCTACAVTIVIFGHLNHSFLLIYLLIFNAKLRWVIPFWGVIIFRNRMTGG